MLRWALAPVVLVSITTSCVGDRSKSCETSADCLQGGIDGVCLESPRSDSQWCAFPDPEGCLSGLRWGLLAGDDLSRVCVEDIEEPGVDAGMPQRLVFRTVDQNFVLSPVTFVAFRDTDGGWTRVTGNGIYEVDSAAANYGWAWACDDSATTGQIVVQTLLLSTSEATEVTAYGCGMGPPSTLVVDGAVSGLAGENARVAVGTGFMNVTEASPSYSLLVAPGIHDVLASRAVIGEPPDSVFISRSHQVTQATTVDIDFASFGEATTVHPMVVNGIRPEDTVQTTSFLHTPRGVLSYGLDDTPQWAALTSPLVLEGDERQAFRVTAIDDAAEVRRTISIFSRTAAPMTLQLPPVAATTMPSVEATSPMLRIGLTWTGIPGAQLYSLSSVQSGAVTKTNVVWATAGWLNGTTSLAQPDLSEAQGWVAGWGLVSGVSTDVSFEAHSSTAAVLDVLAQPLAPAEQQVWLTRRSFTLAP